MIRIAFFDLDGTLIDGDSEFAWSRFLVERGLDYMQDVEHFQDEYRRGVLDIDEYMRFQLQPLTREDWDTLLAWRSDYLADELDARLRSAGVDRIREHKERGDVVVLASASHDFLAEAIATELGIEDCLATRGERADGRYTGRLAGDACFREGKLLAVERWLAERNLRLQDLEESWFYSDSHNDLPLLAAVSHPVCVTPDETLRERAAAEDWRVVEDRGWGLLA
jgi:HAD superfamily hydrolase (TIGR01490 family)